MREKLKNIFSAKISFVENFSLATFSLKKY